MSFATLSNEKLFQLCRLYGARALEWRQKFIGLLPEVNKRRLFEKKGFSSIFEFAAKLAGLSEDQVRTALNLEKKFEDKPLLKNLLLNGEVSINKLVRIQSVATQETQEFWATQVQLLPNRALEVLVQDERKNSLNNVDPKPLFEDKSLHVQRSLPQISDDVMERLQKLQAKGIDINQLLTELLDKHEEEIEREKEVLSKEMSENANKKLAAGTFQEPSRYIPRKIRAILKKEYGTKCSIPTCTKLSTQRHHTQRFALVGKEAPAFANDPHYLAPLCREHHLIAHTIDVKFHRVRERVLINK